MSHKKDTNPAAVREAMLDVMTKAALAGHDRTP